MKKKFNIIAKVTPYGKFDYQFRILDFVEGKKEKSEVQYKLMEIMDELNENKFVYDIENHQLISVDEIKYVYILEEEELEKQEMELEKYE